LASEPPSFEDSQEVKGFSNGDTALEELMTEVNSHFDGKKEK